MPKISVLPADDSPTGDDLVPTVHNPGGTPITRRTTIADLLKRLFLADGTQLLFTTVADGQALRRVGTNIVGFTPGAAGATVTYTIYEGGGVLTPGLKGFLPIDFAGTLLSVKLMADQAGALVLDLWRDTYPTVPNSGDSICASAKPTLSAAQNYEDTALTGWSKDVVAGQTLGFNIVSVSTITRVTVSLKYALTE